MLKDKLKGIWIPAEIILDRNLSDKEKLIYALVLFCSSQNGYCYITNNDISTIFSISSTQSSKLLNSLKKKAYIQLKIDRNSQNQITKRTITPIKLFANTYLTKVKYPIEDNFKGNKEYIKNKYIKDSSLSNKMETSLEYNSLDWNSFYCN